MTRLLSRKFAALIGFASILVMPVTAFAATSGVNDPAANNPDQYFRGTVTTISSETTDPEDQSITQQLDVKTTSGIYQKVLNTVDPKISRGRVQPGDEVVVIKTPGMPGSPDTFYVSDYYRLTNIIWFALFFFIIVLILGRWRGFTSIIGLIGSVAILIGFILPLIIHGHSPTLVITAGSILIVCVSMFFAHGFNKATTIAVASTGITLVFASIIAAFSVRLTFLFGTGSEEALFVQLANNATLDLRGVLLAGIIIGALGVLDDITSAQTASVRELYDTKPDITFNELFGRVMRIGREHIASLVNTLVLAYAGAAFPLFLLFYSTEAQPLWVMINSQQIAEELVRTLIGSTALVFAVPISSALAAYFYTKKPSHPNTI
ncbi:MAG: YibE/F family protein [Candidatus Magasanikbacteria bacterium]|nr:YibE/F family protein [Candidatus Magasanikbacteria bacterium]